MHGSLLYGINLPGVPFQTKLSPLSSCSLFKLTNAPHAHHHHNYERIQINHHFLCMFYNKSLLCPLVAVTVILHARKHCAEIAVQTGMRWGIFFHWLNFSQIVQFLRTVVCFLSVPAWSVYVLLYIQCIHGARRLRRAIMWLHSAGFEEMKAEINKESGIFLLPGCSTVQSDTHCLWSTVVKHTWGWHLFEHPQCGYSKSKEWHVISRHNVSFIFSLPKCA